MPQEAHEESTIIVNGETLNANESIKLEDDTLIFKGIPFTEKIKIYNGNLDINNQSISYLSQQINGKTNKIGIREKAIIFEDCKFQEDLTVMGFVRKNISFKKCTISTITFKNIKDENNSDALRGKIEFYNCKQIDTLEVSDCIFRGKFYVNHQYSQDSEELPPLLITNFCIKDSVFENNFKLHNCDVQNFKINDTDFMKKADFYCSHLNSEDNLLLFKGINFYDLALFGETKFKKFAQFKYVTFQGYSHFRKAQFEDGLDLEYANIEKEMNFFGIKINPKSTKTTQETYRIIKYQLNKVGNIIDANKYYSKELHEKWRSLKLCSKDFFDWWVFLFHLGSSNHSRWWFLSFLWICFTGATTAYLLDQEIYDSFNTVFSWCFLEDSVKYMSITSIETIKNYPIVFFFNKVSLGYFYYQLLTAIRKDTRQ